MKKTIITLLLLISGTLFASVSGKEKPVTARSGLPLADPFVLLENGTYYAYGTHSDQGIEVYSSTDLQTWKLEGLALDKKNTTQTRWFWAPEVYHIGNIYYMYYSANERLYVATSKSATGPFKQAGERPFLEEGSIDGTLFCDHDGQYYFFFVRFGGGNNIWMARMSDDLLTIRKETLRPCLKVSQDWERDPKYPDAWVNEGPFVVKHKGVYYLTYSANDYRSQNYGIGFATATNIEGPWVKSDLNPVLQGFGGLKGTGHHSFFYDKKGRMQTIFHAHFSEKQIHPRLSYFVKTKIKGGTFRFDKEILVPQMVGK